MPGIFGYVRHSAIEDSQINNMINVMSLHSHFKKDLKFMDGKIAASRVHLGNIGEQETPYIKEKIFLWIEGEAYNLDELNKKMQIKKKGFGESMVEAYESGNLDEYLNKLDGYFCAVLYDSDKSNIKLISDRYGMRMLYWYFKDGLFAWSSDVKGMLTLKGIDKSINTSALNCFFDIGYLLGESTWFNQIRLIKPASVMDINLIDMKINEYHYWKWSQIEPSNLSFDEAVNKVGEDFLESVERRFNPNERIGIALSGGLDSRAIFAAVNHLHPDYKGYTYTFGQPQCDDINIARKVVRLTGWEHEIFYFDNINWFEPRIPKIWNTDGMQDLMHMHGSESLINRSKKMSINLNGFLGDAVLGDTYLRKSASLNSRISDTIASKYYGKHIDMSNIEDSFYNINKSEPFIYMNSARRFVNMGIVNGLSYIDQRIPFFDNKLIERVFSLPDNYRWNNQLYSKMLLRFFPKYFNRIPWQKTGQPVGVMKRQLSKRITKLILLRLSDLFKLDLKDKTRNYTNYPEWIRNDDVSKRIKEIMLSTEPELRYAFGEDLMEKYLLPHLNKQGDYHKEILRIVTMQVYLSKCKKLD